jgi:hypothetical protein
VCSNRTHAVSEGYRRALTDNPFGFSDLSLASLAGVEVTEDTSNWEIWDAIAHKLGWGDAEAYTKLLI